MYIIWVVVQGSDNFNVMYFKDSSDSDYYKGFKFKRFYRMLLCIELWRIVNA
jgi:hypothetical protein